MKTILVLISIMILGLYSCGDDSTNPTPKPNEEIKKYTLEEILADSNWVEITDTLHLEDIYFWGFSYLHFSWQDNNLKVINSYNEYLSIETKSDTIYNYYPYENKGLNKYKINFDTHTLLGFKTYKNSPSNLNKIIFLNEKIKQYQYLVIKSDSSMQMAGRFSCNFIVIPKLKAGYKINADSPIIKGYQ